MKLILIFGDQLNQNISSLSDIDKNHDLILMCEIWEEATYVRHHKKKIAFIFSAMRHFAEELLAKGYKIHYTKLNESYNTDSFEGEIAQAIKKYKPDKIVVTEPSEYRVLEKIKAWNFHIPVEMRSDDRFLCTHIEFINWAKQRKQLRMEYFYRLMRKKYDILMDGDLPEGGKWNYDIKNRKRPTKMMNIQKKYMSNPDDITHEVMALTMEYFSDNFGDLEPFYFAVTRDQALQALDLFIE